MLKVSRSDDNQASCTTDSFNVYSQFVTARSRRAVQRSHREHIHASQGTEKAVLLANIVIFKISQLHINRGFRAYAFRLADRCGLAVFKAFSFEAIVYI